MPYIAAIRVKFLGENCHPPQPQGLAIYILKTAEKSESFSKDT